jgi:cell division protein FtsA
MDNKDFQTFFDCGSSKVRAATFKKNNYSETFQAESKFLTDHSNLKLEIQKIVTSFEKDTHEYIDNISLMIDSPKMLSIGISISKKFDGSKLKQTNVKFLIQEMKQQILEYYTNYNIAHIIINNYKIDGTDYSYLPDEIECHFISLDILFICLPSDIILYFKDVFSKSNILIDQVICSSYARSINYIDNLNLNGHLLFIDVGFNKTSLISCSDDKVFSLDILPVGGNHITKDISKILNLDLIQAEKIKLNFFQNSDFLESKNFSIDTLQKIIFTRTEEILELCTQSAKLNSITMGPCKIFLMGESSKSLYNQHKSNVSFSKNIDFLEETLHDICESGLKCGMHLNKQEVVVVPKKQTKQGFFEKLFHFFG